MLFLMQDFEVHVFEEGEHGMSLATQASVTTKSQMKPDAAKWADLAGVWLEKRFALPIPEDMEAIAGGVL